MGIFIRELLLCLEAFAAGGEPELPPLPTTYVAFVRGRREWLASDQSKAVEAYWLDRLAAPLPQLRIWDYDAPAEEVVNETLEFGVGADTASGLAALARKLRVTPHVLLLSAYAVALRGTVVAAWTEVLGFAEADVRTNFFEAGGDSFSLLTVAGRLRAELGLDIPVRALVDAPTVETLAAYIEELRGAPVRPAAATHP
ncbi:phosphopantetheine-binding protein [Streptomyces sioyaensis]|uniref:phosphopantetheine-binding protein n=1 Tax=Streptomyces sioyaensis TaxID=67364 RepID=UPI003713CF35